MTETAQPLVVGNPFPGPPASEPDFTTPIWKGPGEGVGLTVRQVAGRWRVSSRFFGWDTCVSLEEGAWENVFDRCFFAGSEGVRTTGRNNNLTFRDCVFRPEGDGSALVLTDEVERERAGYGTGNIKLRDSKLNGPIIVPPTTLHPVRSVLLDGCQVEQIQSSPIQLSGPWNTWALRDGYVFHAKDGVSPTIDIRHPGGPLIVDGVDFGWLPSGQSAIRAPRKTEIALRNCKVVGPGAKHGLVEWV